MGSQGWIVITEVEGDWQVRTRTESLPPLTQEATLLHSLSGDEKECECQDNLCFSSCTDGFKLFKKVILDRISLYIPSRFDTYYVD